MTNLISDEKLMSAIKGKIEERNWALKQFFQNKDIKDMVINYVVNHGGNRQDGQDVFQDSVILFDRAIRENTFKGQSSLTTFFVGIAKWRWVSYKRKFGNNMEFKPEQHEASVDNIEVLMIEGERLLAIEEVLTRIGDRCKKVLKLYKLSYSMEEIAEIIGLNSPEMAKKEAYKCRSKFKEFVLSNPDFEHLLTTN